MKYLLGLVLCLCSGLALAAPVQFNSAHGETPAAADKFLGYDATRATTGYYTGTEMATWLDTLYFGIGDSLTLPNGGTLGPAATTSGDTACIGRAYDNDAAGWVCLVNLTNGDDPSVTIGGTGARVVLPTIYERLGATFDGGGSAIALNKIAYVHVPYAVTVSQWTVVCDQDSGANGIIITPYMDAFAADTLPSTTMCTSGTAPNTTGGAGAGGTAKQATWDCNITAIPADSLVSFKVTQAPSSATWCTVSLKVAR